MRRRPRPLALLALTLALPGCFMLARERRLAGTWTGSFTIEDQAFAVAAELRRVDGRLEGPIVAPGMNATLTVFLLEAERLSLTGEYAAQGCRGTLTGEGTLREDDAMAGTLSVEDTCTGAGRGRFELRRRE